MVLPAQSQPLPDSDLMHWLALRLTCGLGPKTGWELLQRFGSPQAIFRCSPAELEGAGVHPGVARSLASGCAFEEAADQLDRAKRFGALIVTPQDNFYPELLREIYDPPILLFTAGRLELLDTVMVAIVGSRRATHYGLTVAQRFAHELAGQGATVISGMARGIDTAAHKGALEAQGSTVAVFGCGVDVVYPAENRKLAAEIQSRGLLLSEYPMGAPAYPQNFPVRNRIVSGLSSAILVVEGAQYSGSSITARLALDQNREVFAVPGNVTSSMSWGPNLLIKQGAHLAQEASDILDGLHPQDRIRLARLRSSTVAEEEQQPNLPLSPMGALGDQLLRILTLDMPLHLDDIVLRGEDSSSSEIIAMLFELEMAGRIRQLPGRRYVKVWREE